MVVTTHPVSGALQHRPLPAGSEAVAAEPPAPTDVAETEPLRPGTPLMAKVLAGALAGSAALLAVNVVGHIAGLPGVGAKLAASALALGAAAGGYAAADVASGVFHWAVDNYPDENTPVIGRLAADFQVHHHHGRNILRKSFWHNCALGGKFVVPMMAAVALAQPHYLVAAGALTFFGGNVLAQGYHMWSHQGNQQTKLGAAFEKTGLAISRRNHAKHHAMPWDDYYCIVNGMMNPLLHRVSFWRKLERGVHRLTGREPRSWRDPGVKALAMGEISLAEFQEKVRRKEDLKAFRVAVEPERAQVAERLERQMREARSLAGPPQA
ncbi:MAG: fatty acid desaturase CarF family protein [Candidatus Eremiobacterota bacterium]